MKKKYDLHLSKRRFLINGSKGLSAFLIGAIAPYSFSATNSTSRTSAETISWPNVVGDLLPADENGLQLPSGFKSRIIARSGQTVTSSSNYIWHDAPDGGACFETNDGGWIYVSNSEIKGELGGVGAIRFDADANVVDAYPILEQTNNNCAGGKTPWNTWLSCEEIDRGRVFECDPFGNKNAEVRLALGRFKHEAVAVDPIHSHLYLTEDEPDGCLYRFTPDKALPDLSSGTLEVASIHTEDGIRKLHWSVIEDPEATDLPTRFQADDVSRFRGGEGIAFAEGFIYFTTKYDNRVWSYDTNTQIIDVLYDDSTSDTPILTGVDNVTITASGDILVAEDGGDMQIVMLSLSGSVVPLLKVEGQDGSEICGPAFDPSYRRLYFSSQRGVSGESSDGIVYEISY